MYKIFNETNETIPEEKLIQLLKYALEYKKLENVYFNVIFVSNEKIKDLNKQYRKIDKETDVITFALEDSFQQQYAFGRLLGDIYVSVPKAKEQAKEYQHSELREYSFLTIHGFLHLLGYDHISKEDELIMFQEQEDILNGFGITK